ncbi:MAG: hypothetical protein KIG14_03230 [Candidatus Sacchiramonaceae bacterium]|nr:hypothetical protein [Candidatus Saccharimonadaceae bacterium]
MEPQLENRLPKVKIESQKTVETGFNGLNNPDQVNATKALDTEKSFNEAVFASEQLRNEAEASVPQATPPAVDSSQSGSSADGVDVIAAPQVAQDGDLMEKEWLDKLKKMVKETHDPYLKQKYFRDIQMDYMKKRYGRILGGGK